MHMGNYIERLMHTTVNVAWSKNLTFEEGTLLWGTGDGFGLKILVLGVLICKDAHGNDLEELGCVGITHFMGTISGF